MKHLTALLLIILYSFRAYPMPDLPPSAISHPPMDMAQAKTWYDGHPGPPPQGIYQFHDIQAKVRIHTPTSARPTLPRYYEVSVIESPNLFLTPGMVIGYLFPTPDSKKFTLWIYTKPKVKKGQITMTSPQSQILDYDSKAHTLTYSSKPSFSWSMHPLALIPSLRSLLRVNIRSAQESVPLGMSPIYPFERVPSHFPIYL